MTLLSILNFDIVPRQKRCYGQQLLKPFNVTTLPPLSMALTEIYSAETVRGKFRAQEIDADAN